MVLMSLQSKSRAEGLGYAAQLPVFLLAVVAFSGCPTQTPQPVEADYDGLDPAVRASPGESRAGWIRPGRGGSEAIFGGIGSEARAGDVKLYNSRVQFVVQGARPGHGYVPTGGNIIDADLVRSPDTLGRDTIDDLFLSFGIGRLFDASEVTILADGSDGGPALVGGPGGGGLGGGPRPGAAPGT